MINLSEIKNKHTIFTTLALALSFYVLCFSVVVSLINVYNIDLVLIIGYSNFYVNFLLFWSIVSFLTWGLGELFIRIVIGYFESAKLFFALQRVEIKLVLRYSFILRNLVIGGVYILAYYLPVLFNWMIVFELLVNTCACVIFFLIARKNFGGDYVGLHIFRATGRLYFLFIAISLIFEVGGYLI